METIMIINASMRLVGAANNLYFLVTLATINIFKAPMRLTGAAKTCSSWLQEMGGVSFGDGDGDSCIFE